MNAAETSSEPAPEVLLVAAFDSQLKWCAGLRDAFEARGWHCRVVVPDTRSALSDGQVAAAGFDDVDHLTWARIVDLATASDVVVSAQSGPLTRRLIGDVAARDPQPGPVLVSGWVGVIIERLTAGYLDRAGCDVVAVNSGDDLAAFRRIARALDITEDNLVLSGLPFLSTSPRPTSDRPIRTVVFADQPTVPEPWAARRHLYLRLAEHARRHPDRTVLLKPRHKPGEDTFHRMDHHPADVLAGENLPPNFHLTYEPISSMLDHVDLLLTVSSTASLEAVDRGVRVAIVSDLGVREGLGNHVYLDSGLIRTFDQIDADDIGTPSAGWLESWFGHRSAPAGELVADRVEKLLASGERPGRPVVDAPWFETPELEDDPRARPVWMTAAWSRRVRERGAVVGTAAYAGHLLLPPAVTQGARRLRRRAIGR